MDELGDEIAIDELKKEEGRSNTIDMTEACSPFIFAYLCPRANLAKVYSKSKAGEGI